MAMAPVLKAYSCHTAGRVIIPKVYTICLKNRFEPCEGLHLKTLNPGPAMVQTKLQLDRQ